MINNAVDENVKDIVVAGEDISVLKWQRPFARWAEMLPLSKWPIGY